ncbi:MAG: sugar ABC transporter ATP-binding protein [Eubacteriales bacterium]|nr:sugar ABC transporter ATP-binding protein [Eubacteriales bacterium]
MEEFVLQCKDISKSFPGVQALDKVQFDLRKGEVHALCGENGAGKSTLIKIITGMYTKDSGEIFFEGKKVNYNSTTECRKLGISLIPQEIHLADTLTVAENVFMTSYPKNGLGVDWNKMNEQTEELQKKLGQTAMSFKPTDIAGTLSMGQKQLVEIMKAISTDVKIIAFDEPTSSLSEEETQTMFNLIEMLSAQGISILYVSHRLAEIFRICDRVSVFKDGQYVGTKDVKDTTAPEIISMMVGRDLTLYKKEKRNLPEDYVLEVDNLCWSNKVKDISFKLKRNEVLGIFGIVGAGRTETARTIFGLEKKEKGTVKLNGKMLDIKQPKDAVDAGIGFVTEDRRGEGLALAMTVAENVTMPYVKQFVKNGSIDLKNEAGKVREMVETFRIKTPKVSTRVESLSGGNQQKIVISKWIGADSEVLIFDEPTRGIDVGAKSEIYALMDKLSREEGKSIILITSELPELLAMSDRILVFRDGMIAKELTDVESLSEEDVLKYAINS